MHLKNIRIKPDRYPTTEHYPFNLDIFRTTGAIEFPTPVTFLVGENGTGKSTLLKAICRRCGIHIWQGVTRERFVKNPHEDKFWTAIDVQWTNGPVPGSFFSSDIFRTFAELLDEWAAADPGQLKYFGGKSLMTLSHGQSLMSYFEGRYKIKGLYFMDEPETALSPKTQIHLLELLTNISREGHAQFIIATHSPIIMSCPGATIYSFDATPVRKIRYADTDHYKVYRQFMTEGGHPE
jgi:predicted ATPase